MIREKIKVIQLAHASHSYFASSGDDLKEIILNDWYAKVAKQILKFYPEIEVECWAPEKQDKQEKTVLWNDVKFRFFPVTFSPLYALDFSVPMLRALKEEIRKAKQEGKKLIIHLHEYHNLHGLIIASLFKKEKIIAQHHGGSWPLKHLREKKKYWPFFLFFLLGQVWENKVLKNIKTFYALSQEEIDYLKKITNSKIKFQTMGIGDEYFKTFNKKIARQKLKLKSNSFIILFLARIAEIKGVSYLLGAMKKLKDLGIELKIAGYGQEQDKFKQYAEKNNLKNVKFLGGIFGEKKMQWLAACDVLILPSLKEGAPVSVMESLAQNKPVIVTDVGGVRLMLENDREGIIIRQKSSLDIVRAVKKIINKPIKDVRQYANIYKWKKIVDDTVKDYLK